MRSNLFLNNSNDQNVPFGSFVLIRTSCVTLPWDPSKHFSSIVGRTCSDVLSMNNSDPATLIEIFLPMKEYLPGHHVPDISAGACDDIQELVKTELRAEVINKDVMDLAFVLDPVFIDVKTNIVFLGMTNAFLCRYEWIPVSQKLHVIANIQSFPATPTRSNGLPISIKDTFPKRVFDWIGIFQERCRRVLCRYSEKQGNFCHFNEEFHFPQDVWEYICDRFDQLGVSLTWMPWRTLIRTKTLIGLRTVTMRVSKPIDHLCFKTERELKALREVFGTTCSMGLRQRRPKLGEGVKTLKWGDIINVVVPQRTGDVTLRSGVQFSYNGINLRLSINYEKFIYNRPGTGFDGNLCPCAVLLMTIRHNTPAILAQTAPETDMNLLQVETEFADIHTGYVLVIRGVFNDRVEAEIVEPVARNGEMVSYANLEFVAQCVRRYN